MTRIMMTMMMCPAHLMRFLEDMRGDLIDAPTREAPVVLMTGSLSVDPPQDSSPYSSSSSTSPTPLPSSS
jgi:hypothetical protein